MMASGLMLMWLDRNPLLVDDPLPDPNLEPDGPHTDIWEQGRAGVVRWFDRRKGYGIVVDVGCPVTELWPDPA